MPFASLVIGSCPFLFGCSRKKARAIVGAVDRTTSDLCRFVFEKPYPTSSTTAARVHNQKPDLEQGLSSEQGDDSEAATAAAAADDDEKESKENDSHAPPEPRELDLSRPFDVLVFVFRGIVRLARHGTKRAMASFGDLIEQMKDMPIKGELPSNDDVARVSAAAQTLSTAPNNAPPNRSRLLPTQDEIDMIKKALLSDETSRG